MTEKRSFLSFLLDDASFKGHINVCEGVYEMKVAIFFNALWKFVLKTVAFEH